MDETSRQRFEQAVERKKDESRRRSQEHHPAGGPPPEDPGGVAGDQAGLTSDASGSQDVSSVRDKNSGKGKKTADKWNQ
jgi:hypothetical protein